MHVVPAPDRGVALIYDYSRGVEVVGVDVIQLDRAGGSGLLITAIGMSFEPHGFLAD